MRAERNSEPKWKYSFPSLASLRETEISGAETSLLAALLILPAAAWVTGPLSGQLRSIGGPGALLLGAACFLIIALHLFGWAGVFVRFAAEERSWIPLTVLALVGFYFACLMWSTGQETIEVMSFVLPQILGAGFLCFFFSWDDWSPRSLLSVAAFYCFAYIVLAGYLS